MTAHTHTTSSTSSPLEPDFICVHVCTSCRPAQAPREPRADRPGARLYHTLRDSIERSALASYVEVVEAECLSLCPRPCALAISARGKWTYLFGDQDIMQASDALNECLHLYMSTPDGLMPRDQRPPSMRKSILGRVPPARP
jgi:predicted metal-binding protein